MLLQKEDIFDDGIPLTEVARRDLHSKAGVVSWRSALSCSAEESVSEGDLLLTEGDIFAVSERDRVFVCTAVISVF